MNVSTSSRQKWCGVQYASTAPRSLPPCTARSRARKWESWARAGLGTMHRHHTTIIHSYYPGHECHECLGTLLVMILILIHSTKDRAT